jgi:DNA adenine methylase
MMTLSSRINQLLDSGRPLIEEDDRCLFDLFSPNEEGLLGESTRPPFSFPAGKIRMAKEMVAIMPDHATYVEPFAGSAAVFFAKEPADREVLNDLNPEVAQALRDLKSLSDLQIESLVRCNWVGNKEEYQALFNRQSRTAVGRLHRFLYLAKFSHNSTRRKSDYCKRDTGRDSRRYIETRLKPAVDRLKNVTILSEDYQGVIERFDSPSTLFFIDPPYSQYNALTRTSGTGPKTGEGAFDENRFMSVLKAIKGKYILNYGERGNLPKMLKDAGMQSRVVHRRRLHRGGKTKDPVGHLIGTNYGADISRVESGR